MIRRRFLLCMAAVPVSLALVRAAEAANIVRRYSVVTRLAIDNDVPAGTLCLRLIPPAIPGAFNVRWSGQGIRSTLVGAATAPLLELTWANSSDRSLEIIQVTPVLELSAEPIAGPGFQWEYSATELA